MAERKRQSTPSMSFDHSSSIDRFQRNASFSNPKHSYYKHHPDYNHFVANRRHTPSSQFDLMLLDVFRPLCAPSTIQPLNHSQLSSTSSESADELSAKNVPTIVLHSGSDTDSDESITINDESDEYDILELLNPNLNE
jgi:hypothetical protein